MATISSLVVELQLQANNFNNAIKDAQREAKEFEKTVKPSKEALGEMGTAMTATGGIVVGAFLAMTKSTADYLDSLNDARQKTGVTANDLANLGFAAEQSGSSFDGMSTGLKFLAKNMELASLGGKQQEEAFNRMGISVTDATGRLRPTKDVMLDVADRFANMQDGAEKSAISMQLFGKAGADLIPTLNAGSAGLAEMAAKHEQLAGVITAESAKAGDEFNDRLKELTTSFQGIVLVVGETFMPILSDLMVQATGLIVGFRDWAKEHQGLIKAVGVLAVGITGAGGLLLGLAGVMAILPELAAAFALLTAPITLTIGGVAALVVGLVYFRNEIAGGVAKAIAYFLKAIGLMDAAVAKVAEAIGLNGMAKSFAEASTQVNAQAANMDDMSNVLLESTSTVIGNTKAVDDAIKVSKAHTFELGKSAKAIEEQEKALKKAQETIDKYVHEAQNELIKAEQTIQSEMTKTISAITAADAAWKKLLDKAADADFFQARMQGAGIGAVGAIIQEEAQKTLSAPIQINTKIAFDAEAEKKKLNTAVTEIKESAGKVFDDMFIKGEGVFSSLTNLLKGGALSLGRSIFEDVAGALLGPIKKAFNDFFAGLLESTGINAFVEGLGKKLGGVLSKLFDIGSGGASAAGSVAGGAGAAGGGAGGAAGGAASGLAGAFISGGLALAGGIIGGFIAKAHQEDIANNTHNIQVEVKDLIEQIMWPIHGMLERTEGHNITQVNQLDAIYNTENQNELLLAQCFNVEFSSTRDVIREAATAVAGKFEAVIKDMTQKVVEAVQKSGNVTLDGRTLAQSVSDNVNFGGVRLTASEVRR